MISPTLMRYSIGALLALALMLGFAVDGHSQLSVTYSANGVFTVPPGVSQVTVECWGGGGRGGSRTNDGGGAGGGGGAYARSVLPVTPGNYTVTVGTGSSTTGTPGGDSWFGNATTILAKGGASPANNVTTAGAGGSAAASIGTVKFNGGNGAAGSNSDGNDGGGGGSSAGTALAGTNATNFNGAVAPAGGGDGGAGKNGGQGNGVAGSTPGGGGGGGKRTSSGTRTGGNGANGQVIVTFDYANGNCMAPFAYNLLPDNGCGSNNKVNVTIPISGLPTVLGTGAGNARLESVEVIVSHTYNRDIQITLAPPGGASRNLIINRFGSGDNLGNPSACPGVPMVFVDGGTALTNTNTNNVSGNWAPEESLAGFTGDPNGTWVMTVCDNEALDLGHIRYVKLNFCTVPLITASSSNSPVCAGNTLNLSATATGTAPLTYAWTGTGTFSPNAASASPSVSGAASGNYNITVSNGCGSTNVNVPVTVTTPPAATITYLGNPYCQSGSATARITGSLGGVFSAAPAGLSIVPGTGTVDLGSSTVGTYTVTYTIAASGGCPLFTTTTSITVDPPSTWYQDLDGDGFGDPAVSTTSCTPVAGHVANNNDNCPVLFGLIGDACDDGDINTVGDLINGSCVCAGTDAPWYSQGNGTFADPIWSHNIGGPGAAASLNAGSSVVIQSGHTVSLAGTQDINDLTVQSGATFTIGANTLNIFGTSVSIDGTLGGGTGTVLMQASAAATLAGSGAANLFNLTVDVPSGVNCSVNVGIRGTLQLDNGTFTASGPVRLVSNATGTGRLGPVAATASYSGNLTVNRFIPAGATNWRMLGSSVGGQTINDLKDDFYTAGFPGSHYPGFYSPAGSGILWPSIRWYDETNTGSNVNDGLVGATGTGQALTMGQGFAAWSGSGFTTTTAFTIDFVGPPHVASSPITLPMTWTNTGAPATDGWNMVSNPLPSPVRFDQLVRGADVEDYIIYYDPATGNNATYDISLGAGINGGTNIIQSSQGFWLKANGPALTTTVSESAKVAGNSGGFFGGDQVRTASILSLEIASTINQYRDQTLIVFSEGTPATEEDDVPKFVFAHPEAPQVSSMGLEGNFFAINCYGPYSTDISIPVSVNVAVNGNYTLTANGLDDMGLSCVRLEDLATGDITPLQEGSSYTFTALASDNEHIARFLIHATAPLNFNMAAPTCAGSDNGAASVEITDGPVHIQWIDEGGLVLLDQEGVMPGTSSIDGLEPGEYLLRIFSNSGCGVMKTLFVLQEPADLEAAAVTRRTSCPDSEDGTIDLTVLGGTLPYSYAWNNGSTSEDIMVASGAYSVAITDANGCTLAPQQYVVGAGDGPEASLSVQSSTVMVDEEVTFFSGSDLGLDHSWDFGDGATSTATEPVHSYELPGVYTVTLTVDDGDCTSSTTIEMTVETTTGLATIVGPRYNAWVSGDQFVIDHAFDNGEPVLVRILSTAGQLVQEHRFPGHPARLTLPNTALANGVWLVRVSNGNHVRTFSLPVVK